MSRPFDVATASCTVLLLALGACATSGGEPPASQTVESSGDRGEGRAASTAGRGVLLTVTGSVGLVFGDHAFELGVHGAGSVLVISPDVPVTAPRGSSVRVTGVVEPLRLRTLLDRGVDLDVRRLRPFEGSPALIATLVELDPEGDDAAP